MRHFILFIIAIFLGLFLAVLNKNSEGNSFTETKPTLRIFGYSSFTSHWGPGPILKEMFEKDCACKVEFIEGSDSGVLLQRLKIEGETLGADLVVGLDQFDLQKALVQQKWQQLNIANLDIEPEIKMVNSNNYFVPYDWGLLSLMVRKNEWAQMPHSLDELLDPRFNKKIILQDPRTSSPGFQFLWWVIQSKGEEKGFQYIQKMMDHAHSFSPSWSSAIGLYNKKQAQAVFTYVTSPLYYQLEEKNEDHQMLEFKEDLPTQFEFMGIPEICKHCDLAEKFVNLMLSAEGQKILMQKNYMFPVLRGVKEGTPFSNLTRFGNHIKFEIPSDAEVERLLKRWSEIRRGEKVEAAK